MILTRVIILCLAVTEVVSSSSSSVSQCDQFSYNTVCDLSYSNLLNAILDLEDEIQCQSECQALPDCTNFSWLKLQSAGTSKCVLLNSCNSTEDCAGDCLMSVSGPVSPSLTDTCCTDLGNIICDYKDEVGQVGGVQSDQECQNECRDEKQCRYWTLVSNLCFLYTPPVTPHNRVETVPVDRHSHQ